MTLDLFAEKMREGFHQNEASLESIDKRLDRFYSEVNGSLLEFETSITNSLGQLENSFDSVNTKLDLLVARFRD